MAIFFASTAQSKAVTKTPSSPSELPLVLIVATIGFNSQMLANFNALSSSIFLYSFKMRYIIQPAATSPTANRTLPKENQA